ncbi:asparagine synthase (glutamine-hydrolyzing), partial [Candidatus Omnitrophota bacterium]
MCGIVGIHNYNKQPVSAQLLTTMRDAMYSRGPDDAGIWLNDSVGFGHRRLSIIDLSSKGHQPMVDEKTGSVIIYNGEVYNYQSIRNDLKNCGMQFHSRTDTEVVLKAFRQWGHTCVSKLNGMFAFAIYDKKRNGIFLARDRIGIKPLYYYYDEKTLIFASRLTPLMIHPACPDDIDTDALSLYVDLGFIPAPWSIIKGIKKLKPGHTLWIDEKGLQESCYWNLDSIPIDHTLQKASNHDLVDRLDMLLHNAVQSRLISDVPLGVFLSGGIDSTLITALMCRHSQTSPKTFTIGFEEKQYDESSYARSIAQHLGTDHSEMIMKSSDLLPLLDDNTVYYDEPFADYSSLPTMMVSRFARKAVTVCLSGDGGDELFAGYHSYLIPLYLQNLYRTPYSLRSYLGKFITRTVPPKFKIIGQGLSQGDMFDSFTFIRSITREHKRQSFFETNALRIEDLFKKRAALFPKIDEISKFCRLDISYYLPDDILQKVDVASMSVSLEARVPLLDHRIVE